jgi:hypothetical protein
MLRYPENQPARSMRIIRPGRIVLSLLVSIFLLGTVYSQEGLRVGVKAPGFELPAVGGKKIALREFQNKKIVIVHFWKSK